MNAPNEETQRLRVIRLAQSAGLPVRKLLRLSDGERDTLATCTDAECLAYLHALLLRATLRAGKVPQGWTQVCRCEGCGAVDPHCVGGIGEHLGGMGAGDAK